MVSIAGLPVTFLADASAASQAMHLFITPVVATLCALASLSCVFFLVHGGMLYMSSTGSPDRLDQAKRIIRNALIGLVLVLAAASLTAILSHAYTTSGSAQTQNVPALHAIDTPNDSPNLIDVMMKAITGFLRNIVKAAAAPFLQAISYFINNTPLMADNSSVFNLWIAIVGIADVLFVLVVSLIGFQVMSSESLGIEEVNVKQLLPRLTVVFLLMNTSIFAIDAVITLSNAMIHAVQSAFPSTDIWLLLADLTKDSSVLGIVGLLMMVALLVLTIMLLVYYVLRLVVLYIGAILSPLIVMVSLLPAFRDFALTALKTYLVTIFVLFVHAIIMLLAASLFLGIEHGDNGGQPNTLMALLVGLATVVALLKTQSVLRELSYASSAPRAARELSSSFMRSVGYINNSSRNVYKGVSAGRRLTSNIAGGGKSGTNSPDSNKGENGARSSPISTSDAPSQTGQTVKAKKGKQKS